VDGAFRETEEELGRLPERLAYSGTVTTDFAGWQYHTVVFRSPEQFAAPGNWEVAEHRWVTVAGAAHLLLHPGFAVAFPQARAIVEREMR
jgi:8-oxo-dGTP diphosphatase